MDTLELKMFALDSECGYYTGKEIKLGDGRLYALCSGYDKDAIVYASREEAKKAADIINNRIYNCKFTVVSVKHIIDCNISVSTGG